jgi:Uma2 family endonuclease
MSMATRIKRWTLRELHSLPDDGNKYEVVRGELFVTPAPTDEHETIAARLTDILGPYVREQGLGYVYHPRAVIRCKGSEVEPDLFIRQPHPNPKGSWASAPTPILVVEILSESTRRRDCGPKRDFYIEDVGIAEYWIVDPEELTITSVRKGEQDRVVRDRLVWSPAQAREPLLVRLRDVFGRSQS